MAPAAADLSEFTHRDAVSAWAKDGVGLLAGTSADILSPKNPRTMERSILLVCRGLTNG